MDANRSKLSRHSSKDTLQKASSSDRLSPQHLKSSASKIRSLRNDNFVGSMSSVLDLNQDLESNVLKNRKEYSTDSLGNLDKSTQNFEKASEKRREKRDKRERKSKESRVKLDQNAIEIVNPSTKESIFIDPKDIIVDKGTKSNISLDTAINDDPSSNEFTNMALLSRDPNNIKVQAEFKDQGDKFVAVKNLKKHESKSTKTDPESNLITIASNFDKMSRHVLIFLHQILAGCCLISLILLPTRDLGDYTPIQLNNTNLTVNILFRGTVVPIDTKNLVTSLPSKTQLFLASFSQTSQVFSWVFNILSTIAMVNAIEVAIKSRLDFLKTSSTRIIHVKVYILKFLLVASSLVSFISTLILIPIETRISDPEGVYGTGQWFFYPLELKSSVFITGNVMASWLVLNICRLVFGLVGWLCLFMTCYMKKAQKQKDRDVNSIKMV